MATIGERLSSLIEEKGMHQKEIAGLLDIKVPTFNGYVNNIREPNVETLKKIADFFDVTVDYLIGHTDNRHHSIKNIETTKIKHLDDELNEFVNAPENKVFIEIARDIKRRLYKT